MSIGVVNKRSILQYFGFENSNLVERDKIEPLRFKCLDNCDDCCKDHLLIVNKQELSKETVSKTELLDPKESIRAVKRCENGHCTFLKNSKCVQYDRRFLACVGYPFFVDPYTGKVYVDMNCPGIGEGDLLPKEKEAEMVECRKKYWELMNLTEEEKKEISERMADRQQ